MTNHQTTDPVGLLCKDARRAAALDDPLAHRCFLATVTQQHRPALRTMVLRGLEASRIELFFSATSAKWRDLLANGRYELLVYWPTIECQYRMSGGFEEIPFENMAASWAQKSDQGKLLDLYYSEERPQGSRIDDLDRYVDAISRIRRAIDDSKMVEAPATVRGIRLEPSRIDRLDLSPAPTVYRRHLYVRVGGGWQRELLVP